MAKKKTTKKRNSGGLSSTDKAAIGIGLTTAAVAAAGAYFLYGSPNAGKNRKTIKSWTLKAKAEVLEALESAEKMTEIEYQDLIEVVAATYASVKGATKGDVAAFRKEMKDHWHKIERSTVAKKAKQAAKTAATNAVKKAAKKKPKQAQKKAARKTAKKTTKKVVKKTTKKKR